MVPGINLFGVRDRNLRQSATSVVCVSWLLLIREKVAEGYPALGYLRRGASPRWRMGEALRILLGVVHQHRVPDTLQPLRRPVVSNFSLPQEPLRGGQDSGQTNCALGFRLISAQASVSAATKSNGDGKGATGAGGDHHWRPLVSDLHVRRPWIDCRSAHGNEMAWHFGSFQGGWAALFRGRTAHPPRGKALEKVG